MAHPVEVQQEQLHDLVGRAAETVFGKKHGFASIRTPEQFARQVPVTDYDAFCGYRTGPTGGTAGGLANAHPVVC